MGGYFSSHKISDYRIIKELGRGTFGITYLIEGVDGEKYAMKKIPKAKLEQTNMLDSVRNEININRKLSSYMKGCNPNIVCYKDYQENDNYIYIFLQYIRGKDLFALVFESNDIIHYSLVKNIMEQCLLGLSDIHEAGYAHRDIKLENIMIDQDNEIYIIDFGFACNECIVGPGTIAYAPPELLGAILYNQPKPQGLYYAQKHDIWAMGIVFYCILNRKFPFGLSSKNKQQMENVLSGVAKSKSRYPTLNQFVDDMLDPNPDNRLTARELFNRLSET